MFNGKSKNSVTSADSADAVEKKGAVNDRPLFMQNGNNNRRFDSNDNQDIGAFRSALPQFIAVSIKNILLFGYGMTLGFPTIVIPAIQGGDGREHSDSQIILNKEQISWFSSINLICVPLGCLFSGTITQPLGKRRAMQFVNLPILAAWLLFTFATSTEHLYAALCLAGLGGGLMEAPVLTYVAEITEPKYRGILAASGTTCVITGVFVQFSLGSLMDWRNVAAVSATIPIISIIMLCFVPESPIWLIREQRFREAVKSLQWLRGWVPEHRIEAEFNRLYDELITQPALEEANDNKRTCFSRFRMFRKRTFVVPFFLVTFAFFTGHFSGKTPLQTYAVQIFHTLKAPMNKFHATILLGVAELISTIMSVVLIHFTGKRPLVLVSTVGTGICFFGAATYAHFLNEVPGFTVNNVVANASAIVPKEHIISQANITKIFERVEQEIIMQTTLSPNDNTDTTTIFDFEDTTMLTTLKPVDDTETTALYEKNFDYEENSLNRKKREKFGFVSLDYDNETSLTENFEIFDTDEDETTTFITVTISEATLMSSKAAETSQTTTNAPKIQVVDELLLPVPKQEKNYLVWLPLILLLLSAFFSHLGIRMIPWILIGEVFPANIRNTASGLAGGVGYVFGFLANKLFLFMVTNLTLPGTFWFYSAVAFVGALVLYFALPETEGRTLGEIEAHFSKKSDMNLFRKPNTKKTFIQNEKNPAIQLDSLQNLHIPLSPQTEAKIIHLQQSDFTPQPQQQRHINGETNLAFEESNTTHL